MMSNRNETLDRTLFKTMGEQGLLGVMIKGSYEGAHHIYVLILGRKQTGIQAFF